MICYICFMEERKCMYIFTQYIYVYMYTFCICVTCACCIVYNISFPPIRMENHNPSNVWKCQLLDGWLSVESRAEAPLADPAPWSGGCWGLWHTAVKSFSLSRDNDWNFRIFFCSLTPLLYLWVSSLSTLELFLLIHIFKARSPWLPISHWII